MLANDSGKSMGTIITVTAIANNSDHSAHEYPGNKLIAYLQLLGCSMSLLDTEDMVLAEGIEPPTHALRIRL